MWIIANDVAMSEINDRLVCKGAGYRVCASNNRRVRTALAIAPLSSSASMGRKEIRRVITL